MTCPICDQKAANCDCTTVELDQYDSIEELENENAKLRTQLEERTKSIIDAARYCQEIHMRSANKIANIPDCDFRYEQGRMSAADAIAFLLNES